MCGGITYRSSNYDFPGVLEQNSPVEFNGPESIPGPSGDIRPGMKIAVISQTIGKRGLDFCYWGYQPNAKAPLAINAKAENLKTSKYWKNAFKTRRCLIPCDGWYEWVTVEGAPRAPEERLAAGLTRGENSATFIEFKQSPVVYLAGLYGEGAHKQPGKQGQWQRSASAVIITTPACDNIAVSGHHRQPVVLTESMIDQWLDSQTIDRSALLESRNYDHLSIKAVSGPAAL